MNTSKSEQVKQLIDHGLASLLENLEGGKSDQLDAYIAAMAKFHRYSFRNIMLIVSQFPNATQVAGFRSWKKLGRYVRKGEQGITIIAPMLSRKETTDTKANSDEGPIVRYRAAHVFDLSQTDGEPLPHPAETGGDPGGYTERLKALIEAKQITLEYVDDLDGADGSSSGSKIRIRKDLDPAMEFSVLAHELAHELLHWGEQRQSTTKTVRETEAEAVAFIVSSAIGLDAGTASSDYIQIYDGTVETLEASLDAIRKTSSAIIAGISPNTD
ncbi:DUF1738 domain-containing protein [bacterium]|nr:DUF1738 domain-containing protein [bacterium]